MATDQLQKSSRSRQIIAASAGNQVINTIAIKIELVLNDFLQLLLEHSALAMPWLGHHQHFPIWLIMSVAIAVTLKGSLSVMHHG